MELQIESGIKIPMSHKSRDPLYAILHDEMYEIIPKLNIRDSFFVESNCEMPIERIRMIHYACSAMVRRNFKDLKGIKFLSRKEENGVRFWRIV